RLYEVRPALLLLENLRFQRQAAVRLIPECGLQVFVIEREHEELVGVGDAVERRQKVVVVGDEQRVLRGAIENHVLSKGDAIQFGRYLRRRETETTGA